MPSAGSIFVDLLLNDAQYRESLKKSSKASSDFEKGIKNAAKDIAVSFLSIAAAAKIVEGAIDSARIIDDQSKIARSIGISVKSYQALALVADEAGIEQEQLTKALTLNQKGIADGVKGNKDSIAAYEKLGLSVKDLINLSADQQFQKVADALGNIKNSTERTSLALDIFGKNGRAIINVAGDLGDKIREATAFNDKFGISVSDIDAQHVETARDTFDRLERALQGVGNTISVETAPAVTALASAILDVDYNSKDAAVAVRGFVDAGVGAIDTLVEDVNALSIAMGEVVQSFRESKLFLLSIASAPDALKDSLFGTSSATVAAANKAAEDLIDGQEKLDKKIQDASNRTPLAQRVQQARNAPGEPNRTNDDGTSTLDNANAVIEAQKKLSDLYQKNEGLITGQSVAQIKYNEQLKELKELLDAGKISQDQYSDAVARSGTEFQKASDKANVWAFDVDAASKRAAENIQDNLANFLYDPFKDGLKGMLLGFVDTLRKMAAEAASAQILQGIFGSGRSSGTGIFGKIFGSIFGAVGGGGSSGGLSSGADNLVGAVTNPFAGYFAAGGFLPPGQWGVAGEEGAEPIYGGKTGLTVIPNKQGQDGNVYNIDARGADAGVVLRLSQALNALAGPGKTESRVSDAQKRGSL